jgi:hypothetical protein
MCSDWNSQGPVAESEGVKNRGFFLLLNVAHFHNFRGFPDLKNLCEEVFIYESTEVLYILYADKFGESTYT